MPVSAASPSAEELSADIAVLAGEISEAFAGDRWAILNSATDQVKWRLYDGAALRHCCQLLQEMDLAARSGQEFSVRLLQMTGQLRLSPFSSEFDLETTQRPGVIIV
jgi:hypothetical protein